MSSCVHLYIPELNAGCRALRRQQYRKRRENSSSERYGGEEAKNILRPHQYRVHVCCKRVSVMLTMGLGFEATVANRVVLI